MPGPLCGPSSPVRARPPPARMFLLCALHMYAVVAVFASTISDTRMCSLDICYMNVEGVVLIDHVVELCGWDSVHSRDNLQGTMLPSGQTWQPRGRLRTSSLTVLHRYRSSVRSQCLIAKNRFEAFGELYVATDARVDGINYRL